MCQIVKILFENNCRSLTDTVSPVMGVFESVSADTSESPHQIHTVSILTHIRPLNTLINIYSDK